MATHKANIEEIRIKIAEMKGQRICPACGKALEADAVFCSKCGTQLPEQEEAEEAEEEECAEAEVEAFEAQPSEACPCMHEEVAEAVEKARETVEAEKASSEE